MINGKSCIRCWVSCSFTKLNFASTYFVIVAECFPLLYITLKFTKKQRKEDVVILMRLYKRKNYKFNSVVNNNQIQVNHQIHI